MRVLVCAVGMIGVIACSQYPKELEQVLNYAGDNRPELEKVLEHYGQNRADSLKLRAAEFLIVNMPGHESLDTQMLSAYYADIDSILNTGISWQERTEQLNRVSLAYRDIVNTQVEDIRVITSGYLIRNIEQAFDVWQNEPWATHVTFDDLCEYLLPYKVTEGQPFDGWRDSLSGKFCEGLRYFEHGYYLKNSSFMAATAIRDEMLKAMNPVYSTDFKGIPLLAVGNITRIPSGTCTDYDHAVLAVMRSNGIPVAQDFVPQWPYRGGGGGHSWLVLCNELRNNVIFESSNENIGKLIRPESKLGKVYRYTYAINRKLQKMQQEEFVPDLFRNIFLKDVTSIYAPVSTVRVDIHPAMKTRNRYAYLSVFDNMEWTPIAYGDIVKKRVHFGDVCMNIVYLPVLYSYDRPEALNYPFLLDYSGNAKYFVPDTTLRRSIVLHRKYPVFTRVFHATMKTVGAKLQASETGDFHHPVTVHEFTGWKAAETIQIDDSLPPYRYWRFLPPEDEICTIAEMMFYRAADTIPYLGKAIGMERMHRDTVIYSKERVFDNDPLTYCMSHSEDSTAWIGMDFGKPVQIEKIIFLPRSDDNNIRIGDEYELFYWGESGWQSLGRQKAEDIELHFDCVPENALLLLHDHTRGQEERIFTYENGEQVWW